MAPGSSGSRARAGCNRPPAHLAFAVKSRQQAGPRPRKAPMPASAPMPR
jgi:hypothetical protein